MKAVYLCIECRIGYRITYGVAAVDAEDGEKIVLGAVVDVSSDRKEADRLADYCNRMSLNPERLHEAVIDYVDRHSSER